MASTARAPVLVAPAAFKGTLRAPRVAAALARGLEAGGWPVDPCPVADGGAGTLEVLLPALGGAAATVEVAGREVGIALIDGGATALVELDAVLDAEAESSAPAGELLLAAAGTGVELVLVAAGDVVPTDAGAGAIDAINAAGGIDASVVVLCDVRTSVERLGEALAGAGELPRDRARALARRLDALGPALPRDPRGVAYGGAGGGIAAAL